MKILKNIKYTRLVISLGGLSVLFACKSFLDVPPQGTPPAKKFWITADDAFKSINSIYANLRSWENLAFAAIAVESIGSDDAEKGSAPNDADFFNLYDNFMVTASQDLLNNFWTGQYQNIELCNQVLDNVPNINMDEKLKARYLAEALFVRAYSYFRLVRAFGDVPLRLRIPKDASEYNIPRTPKAEIYAVIEKDLKAAASVLPQSYGSEDIGRATKGAALGMLAKVCMYQKKWTDVLNYTNQVMGLGYSLFTEYEKLFRTENENCSESLFEIQCELIPNNSAASNSQYSEVQGVRGDPDLGWGFNVPTQDLADFYETGDPRRDATIIFRGETTPQGDAISLTGPNPRYNQKSYVPLRDINLNFKKGCQQNFRVLRYAEILLMNAEAANETGNSTQAINSLEIVRNRARQGNPTILPKVTATEQAALRNAIWRERRAELAMENDRYFDVIRQGRGADVFGPKGWKAGKNEVWPVPQKEINKSFGVLTQNPGY